MYPIYYTYVGLHTFMCTPTYTLAYSLVQAYIHNTCIHILAYTHTYIQTYNIHAYMVHINQSKLNLLEKNIHVYTCTHTIH